MIRQPAALAAVEPSESGVYVVLSHEAAKGIVVWEHTLPEYVQMKEWWQTKKSAVSQQNRRKRRCVPLFDEITLLTPS